MALIWVLIGTVGALLLVAIGALLSSYYTRREVARSPQAFRCKLGIDPRTGKATRMRWPWRSAHAIWVHDSLVVVSGVVRTRISPLAVHFAEGSVGGSYDCSPSGVGPDPVFLSLELDDGTHVLLAAPRSAKSLVVGPYLAALLTVGASRASDQPGGT
jgi:hypothetical protein